MVNRSKWILLTLGMFISIFGISLLFASRDNTHAIITLVGITMTLSGVAGLISVYSTGREKFKKLTIANGIIATALGTYTFLWSSAGFSDFFLPIALIAWFISTSIPMVAIALSRKREGSPFWIFAAVFCIVGVVMIGLSLLYPSNATEITIYLFSAIFISCGIGIVITPFKLIEKTTVEVE